MPTRPRLTHGERTYPSIQGEILHYGPTNDIFIPLKNQLTVALRNSEAARCVEMGLNVKVRMPDIPFFGRVVMEPTLYLVIDIPETFDMSKIIQTRIDLYAADQTEATIELIAAPWTYRDVEERSGVKLYLSEIYVAEPPRQSRISRHTPIMGYTPPSQRDYDNRHNKRITFWNLGDVVGVDGSQYVIGNISDDAEEWSIRLDRKYHASRFVRVPK